MADRTISSWGQLVDLRPTTEAGNGPSRERRAWVRYVCDLVTICQPASAPSREPFLARIRNVARGGINFDVDQHFDSGSILSVELPGPIGEPTCRLLVCVIHVTSLPGGDWSLGCSFVQELSDEDLQPYGARRLRSEGEDNREWVRFACELEATYRIVRVTERKPAPAKVIDISPRGVGLVIDRAIEPGTVLSVDLKSKSGQSTLRMFACVVRVKQPRQGEWSLGCNFIREISDKEFKALLPEDQIFPNAKA
jgi:PilZ domain